MESEGIIPAEAKDGGPIALKGMKIRDEFVCPITYEVFRDPAVACDGFTYERSAIEKWLRSNTNSPKNGLPMDNALLPNINLKKLIQDLIQEGGAGLYSRDRDDQGRQFEVRQEKVVTMKCLGPAESDWHDQVFTVSPSGCVGGRRIPDDMLARRDFFLFKESTISRKHFEIVFHHNEYFVRDLGSAGGSYIRIFKRKELYPGMIIACGKHQFLVSSVDVVTDETTAEDRNYVERAMRLLRPECDSMLNEAGQLESLIREGQCRGPSGERPVDNSEEIARRLVSLQSSLQLLNASDILSADGALQGEPSMEGALGSQDMDPRADTPDGLQEDLSTDRSTLWECKHDGAVEPHPQEIVAATHAGRRLKLTCFSPEASPIVGSTFVVGPRGATIGRSPTNDIPLCVKMARTAGESEKWTSIDSAVSGLHAHITMDPSTGSFYVNDGSPPSSSVLSPNGGEAKPSLNGTWFRLSGPHQESPLFKLTAAMELLIGTIRFQVGEALTILETNVTDSVAPKTMRADAKLTASGAIVDMKETRK